MAAGGLGLTEVGTEELKRMLRVVHKGELRFPMAIDELTRVGLQHVAIELLGALRGLDEVAVRTLLVCVLAERAPANQRGRRV